MYMYIVYVIRTYSYIFYGTYPTLAAELKAYFEQHIMR